MLFFQYAKTMIEVNELRLGNYAYDDENKVMKICRLETEEYNNFNGDNYNFLYVLEDLNSTNEHPYYLSKVINPISITEQWLLDFGFEKVRNENTQKLITAIFRHKLKPFHIQFTSKTNLLYATIGNSIQYIHELQNLFFALYKEELTLNKQNGTTDIM